MGKASVRKGHGPHVGGFAVIDKTQKVSIVQSIDDEGAPREKFAWVVEAIGGFLLCGWSQWTDRARILTDEVTDL